MFPAICSLRVCSRMFSEVPATRLRWEWTARTTQSCWEPGFSCSLLLLPLSAPVDAEGTVQLARCSCEQLGVSASGWGVTSEYDEAAQTFACNAPVLSDPFMALSRGASARAVAPLRPLCLAVRGGFLF
ncbi:unnamed protein product [Prorocentrum cordatum]|uniref:Uncharacterized protein n=1 Tax=Prorocentrum cordatum TaxID=2364126 RepID=A0ABN9S0Y8_9DINO|nr:unnamed protein product [Polarella glacialis]